MKLLSLLAFALVGRSLCEPGQCEEISIPMCKEIGYNFTRLPNQFNHESQDEVSNKQFLGVTGGDGWGDYLICSSLLNGAGLGVGGFFGLTKKTTNNGEIQQL